MKPPLRSKAEAVETAEYIRIMAAELKSLAGGANLAFLAYLLAMVEDDAQATARRLRENTSADA